MASSKLLLFLIIFICCIITTAGYGQQFVSDSLPVTSNIGMNIPFGNGGISKTECLYPKYCFSPAPEPGSINKLYFRFASVAPTTYINFSIRLASLASNYFNSIHNTFPYTTPNQLVFAADTFKINPVKGQWFGVNLSNTYYFDTATMLCVIIEFKNFETTDSITNGVRIGFLQGNKLPFYMAYGTPGTDKLVGSSKAIMDLGFDYGPYALNNAGITDLISPLKFCASAKPQAILIKIANHGANDLDSLKIGWIYDGVKQVPVLWKNKLVFANSAIVLLGNKIFASGQNHTLKAWVYAPNGMNDPYHFDDTLTEENLHPDSSNASISTKGLPIDSINAVGNGQTNKYNDPGAYFYDNITIIDTSKNGSFYENFPGGINVNKLGSYQIIYYLTDKCGNKDSSIRTVNVVDHLPPVITLKGSGISSICRWASYKDSGYIVSDNYSKVSDIKIDTFGTFVSSGTSTPGNYFLRYKATDKSGNVAYSDVRNIFVIPEYEGDCVSGISNSAELEKSVSIYPNPGNGIFTIVFSNPIQKEMKISIQNALGQLMLSSPNLITGNEKIVVDLNSQPSGIYFVKIDSGNRMVTKKIILSK